MAFLHSHPPSLPIQSLLGNFVWEKTPNMLNTFTFSHYLVLAGLELTGTHLPLPSRAKIKGLHRTPGLTHELLITLSLRKPLKDSFPRPFPTL